MPSAYSGVIDSITVGGAKVFIYIPDGIVLDRWTAPIITVYGNVPFTAESAYAKAIGSGLAAIAIAENACIAFMNPLGETWGVADVDVYHNLVGNTFAERPDNTWVNGKTRTGQYQGYLFRVVVIAEGAGANFASEFLVSDSLYVTSGNPLNHRMPASVMLFNPTVGPTDLAGQYGQEYPAVIVNGSAAINNAYAGLNTGGRVSIQKSTIISGFDSSILLSGYNSIVGKVLRMQYNYAGVVADAPSVSVCRLVDLVDYNAVGVEETVNEFRSLNNNGNGYVDMMYLMYVPENLSREPGSIPVVFAFHGAGEKAEYYAKLTGWPQLGAKEGFVTVVLDQHLTINYTRTMEFIQMVLDTYDFIDLSRVYMTGFSMGSQKTWDVGVRSPRTFAAISPWSVTATYSTSVAAAFPQQYVLPTLYLVGHGDYLSTWPRGQTAVFAHLFSINKHVEPYRYVASQGKFSSGNGSWGVENWDAQVFIDRYSNSTAIARMNFFVNSEGEIYSILGDTSMQGHNLTVEDARLAWDFMKNFSRADDGLIIGSVDTSVFDNTLG